MPRVLIEEKTAEVTSDTFRSASYDVTIIVFGLQGGEEIVVQQRYGNGTNDFCDVYQDGAKVVLTATSNALVTSAPGEYRLYKPATPAAVTASIATFGSQ